MLDIRTFGLSNPPLQTALNAMLKAIVALSEEHKVLKHQLALNEDHQTEASTILREQFVELRRHVGEDFVNRKEWTEGRYEEQRRTDRVNEALCDLRDHVMKDLGTLAPRVTVLETISVNVQAEVARVLTTFVPQHSFDRTVVAMSQNIADLGTNLDKAVSTSDAHVLGAVEQHSKSFQEVSQRLGVISEALNAQRLTSQTLDEQVMSLKKQGADLGYQLQEWNSKTQSDLRELRIKHEAATATLETTGLSLGAELKTVSGATEHRLVAAENRLELLSTQVAIFHDDSHRQQKVVNGATDALTSELAALNHCMSETIQDTRRLVVDSQRTLQTEIDKVRDDVQASRRQLQLTGHDMMAATDALKSEVTETKVQLTSRVAAVEKQKRHDDDAFRLTLEADVEKALKATQLQCKADTRHSLTEGLTIVESQMKGLDATVAALSCTCSMSDSDVRGQLDSIVDRLSYLDQRVGAQQGSMSDIVTVLGIDLSKLPDAVRPTGPSSQTLGDGGGRTSKEEDRRATLTRFVRSLPWYPAVPADASRVTPAASLVDNIPPDTTQDGGGQTSHASASRVSRFRSPPRPLSVTLPAAYLEPNVSARANDVRQLPPVPVTSYDGYQQRASTASVGSSAAPRRFRLGLEVTDTLSQIGALVVRTESGGPAAVAGLSPGDIVTGVDSVPCLSQAEFVAAIRALDFNAIQAANGLRLHYLSPLEGAGASGHIDEAAIAVVHPAEVAVEPS